MVKDRRLRVVCLSVYLLEVQLFWGFGELTFVGHQ